MNLTHQSPAIDVLDYEQAAEERLDPGVWAYLSGGAADERTAAWNRTAFDRWRLDGRVLQDLAGAHTRLTLFEQPFEYPILLAPVAHQTLFHADGELATALGASAMRAGTVVSMQASLPLEDIAARSAVPPWCQIYLVPDKDFLRTFIERVEQSGFSALVVTADATVHGTRYREQRAGFRWPDHVRAVNLPGGRLPQPPVPPPPASPIFSGFLRDAPTWKDLEALVGMTRLPVLLKGITSPLDVSRAVDAGVAGLVVSNHGGRVVDTLPAALDALPRIVDRAGGRLPVLMDGGIRRGTDVFKALALGARAVLVGRPYIHGLVVDGASGVAHVLALLRAELELAMAATGCPLLTRIDRTCLLPSLDRHDTSSR